ncbi:peptide methionine sulfoxide reductase B5 [Eucalyptus grandis]|uniref:peptide methionine sulfoxide reductase B5 n=1 Tax=Eucalyptus grandis TaxID=71139 RepID=UPI00192EEDEB|nr:peptide methionine sulfoxide reductase B5 [Eucalyptus grandis]
MVAPRLAEVARLSDDDRLGCRDHADVPLADAGPSQSGGTKPATLKGEDEQCLITRPLHSPRRSALFSPQDPPRVPPDKAAASAVSSRLRRCSVWWFRLAGPFEEELPRRGGGHGRARVGQKSEEWQAVLSPEQFRILRQKGTEYPGTGEYDKFFEEGLYNCAACGTPLYRSTTKFNSSCGWPAFYEGLPGAITCTVNLSLYQLNVWSQSDPDGMRTEITCTACGGHLGHVFKGEGFPTPTDDRHCVNSISLKFVLANSYPSQ